VILSEFHVAFEIILFYLVYLFNVLFMSCLASLSNHYIFRSFVQYSLLVYLQGVLPYEYDAQVSIELIHVMNLIIVFVYLCFLEGLIYFVFL